MRAPVSRRSFAPCSAALFNRRPVPLRARNVTRSLSMTEVSLGSSRQPVPLPAHVAHFYSGPDDLGDQFAFARSAIDDPKEALVLFGPRGVADALLRALEASVGWDLPDWPPPEDLLWMESHFTGAIAKLPVVVVCAYDLTRLPGDALIYGGIETHPLIYLGGQLSANPQFVEPERYITSRLSQLPW